MVLAEGVRGHHAQGAGGFIARAAHIAFKRLPGGKQFLGAFITALPILGQPDGVGGALQQPHPHRALQQLQAAADGGLRAAQLRGGGRQAARLDDAHEGFDQQQAVGAGGGRGGGDDSRGEGAHTPTV
ncbi:hypothetical protein D3C78_1548430 [compost metagenome]